MVDRNIPLTVFDEKVLQRYLFFVLHSKENADRDAKKLMNQLVNFPNDFNLIIPEVEFFNETKPIPNKKSTKKLIEYRNGVQTKVYKPDFVVYPKCDAKRSGPLSGEGIFIEVKWDYEKNFDDHQWLALFFNGKSIIASLNKPNEKEWQVMIKEKSEKLRLKYPKLKKEAWLINAEKNIEHYHIKPTHFKYWAVRNIGMLVNNQLNIGRKRYWLMVLSSDNMKKNWVRMLWQNGKTGKKINKKPFWAWVNEGNNLTQLMKMRAGDEILFIEAKSPHPRFGNGRWGNLIDRKKATDKRLEKAPFDVKSMYHLQIVSPLTRSAYHCHLGNDDFSNFFEDCTANCKTFGCDGCGKGRIRSMNNVKWPHFVKMELIGSPHEPSDYKTLLRGKLGRRLGACASGWNTPAELTDDEFTGLMGQILCEDSDD